MALLKRIWTYDDEDPEVKTLYQYVVDLRDRVEETCKMALALLTLPTERNKLTLAWRGPYKVVGIVGDFDYRVEVSPDKVKTYHINMLKR